MSCSFWRQRSAASSSWEKTTSFTGPTIFSNSVRTAASSRGWRMGMLHYIVRVEEVPSHEAVRHQPLRPDGVPVELLPGPRFLGVRDARPVLGRDPARLRGEGA